MLRLYRTALASGAPSPASGTGRSSGCASPTGRPRVRAGRRFVSITNLSSDRAAAAAASRRSCWPARPSSDGHLPADATAWLRPAVTSRRTQRGGCPPTSAERVRSATTRTTGRRRTCQAAPIVAWNQEENAMRSTIDARRRPHGRRRHRHRRRRWRQHPPRVGLRWYRAALGGPGQRPGQAHPRRRQRLRPGGPGGGVHAFDAQVAQFEAANPDIDIVPTSTTGPAPTFTAALAGGTLPDVFTIPFTDGKSLIEQGQLADITELVKALPYADKFNPNVLATARTPRATSSAVPRAGLRHRPPVQPRPVHAGRPRPGQAAHDLGRGPRRRQGDRREDRLRPATSR